MASSARLRGGRDDGATEAASAWPSPRSDAVLDTERGTYGAMRGAYVYPAPRSDEEISDEDDRRSLPTDNDTEESIPPLGADDSSLQQISERVRNGSRYAQTMREAGVTSPVSSPSARSASSLSSSSSSDALASRATTHPEPLSSRASSVSTATTAATTQVHVPTKRPGQPQFEGFWQVRSLDDLRPLLDNSAMVMKQRRADPNGGFVSVRGRATLPD